MLAVFFLTILALTGCGGEKAPATSNSAVSKPAANAIAEDSGDKLKFKTANDQEALVIKKYADHEKIEIDYSGEKATLKARANENGRLKYKEALDDQEKQLIAEVKYKDDSIKLVDEKEQLLFKIKFKDEKIKIADNEEMNTPFELKSKGPEKTEIRDKSGNEIGNVKFYPETGKLKVKDAANNEKLILKNYHNSAAPGVILFEEIPVKIRCIIINELIKKGK
jgi:hypothetical protein